MADVEQRPAAPDQRPIVRPKKNRHWRWIIAVVVVAALCIGGYRLWKYLGTYEATDDAQVDGHINSISSRIPGNVIEVHAEDEQYVKAGDVLVRLDARDYEVALAKAQADLADAEAALESSRIDVPITTANTASQLKTANSSRVDATALVAGAERQLAAAQAKLATAQAQVREAEATYKNAGDDVARYKLLVDKNEIPRQQYDTAVSGAAAYLATVDARKAAVAEAQQNIAVAQAAI